MNTAFFIALRRLRFPIIALIMTYTISVTGLVLIEGTDGQGNPVPMSWFHAFYFMSYTATTIGFGEIPYAFNNLQRMWVTFCIYLSVVNWAWLLAAIMSLAQDRTFLEAMKRGSFSRSVKRIREPFWLMCGYGQTGAMLCDRLGHAGQRVVVLEKREQEMFELELHDHGLSIPALLADARDAEVLMAAGLSHPELAGVLALTSDDATNLGIAAATRVLNPYVPVYCRSETPSIAESALAFGTDMLINPFKVFTDELRLLLLNPQAHQLFTHLTPTHSTSRLTTRDCPEGQWIICGYGRFGKLVVDALSETGRPCTPIDPTLLNLSPKDIEGIWQDELDELRDAHLPYAAGIVVATGDDTRNLALVALARQVNPDIYVILRQNDDHSALLFQALKPDMLMVPSVMVARQCLAAMTSNLLPVFYDHIPQIPALDIQRLLHALPDDNTRIWEVCINFDEAPAIFSWLCQKRQIRFLDLVRDNRDRDQRLPVYIVAIMRGGRFIPAPVEEDIMILPNDRLLLAGAPSMQYRFEISLRDEQVLSYVIDNIDRPDGLMWRWLAQKMKS
ncbi:NAD-binding protein [Agitococcus lubricus]|uniref:Trk K+ transport system NAD-binding subunit n=1 Tax=Agitococcus lubricus TaxID=1077255 RepID=A0A2T5J061_9GAMM|nr:NAD-binding protein [Agitococcus lubricus]PTQ89738.1 Trk K+ transport system NAD-binding subunit [Agitococcus lubricus]